MNKKKLLAIGSITVIITSIITIVIMITQNKEEEFTIEGISLPKNKEILKENSIENLKITDISLLTRDGISTYTATISNNTEEDIKIKTLYVIFYEKEQEYKAIALYDTKIQATKEKYIDITSEKDLSNITKIDYVLE